VSQVNLQEIIMGSVIDTSRAANTIEAKNASQSKFGIDAKDVANFLLALVSFIKSKSSEGSATEDREVKKGDTLSDLAKQLKTTVQELMKLNPQITDANKIFAGDTIKVPSTSNAKSNSSAGTLDGGATASKAVNTAPAKNNVLPFSKTGSSPANAGGAKDTTAIAMKILKDFEGFQTAPTWDVNALRLGYGSDTKTNADGSVETVKQNTRVNREDADRDLARHVEAFKAKTETQVGKDKWQALPSQAQAALTSFAYNYGSLTDGVLKAAKTCDTNKIASAVAECASHDNGINSRRRNREAELIRSSGSSNIV
jgi:GH24 family phage-related lysozyme (muramidase)/LysM repeat protein